eukprot:6486259-Amphidinium_carterae.1
MSTQPSEKSVSHVRGRKELCYGPLFMSGNHNGMLYFNAFGAVAPTLSHSLRNSTGLFQSFSRQHLPLNKQFAAPWSLRSLIMLDADKSSAFQILGSEVHLVGVSLGDFVADKRQLGVREESVTARELSWLDTCERAPSTHHSTRTHTRAHTQHTHTCRHACQDVDMWAL